MRKMNFGRWINEPPREVNQITKRIMIMKKLIIEQLKEGFLFTDDNDDKYAVTSGSLSKRVQAYFGMTRPDSKRNRIVLLGKAASQSSSMNDKTMPHGAQGEIPALSSSSTEQTQMQPDIEGINKDLELKGNKAANDVVKGSILDKTKLGTPDNSVVQSGQCAEILEIPGFDSPAAPLILHPSDLKNTKFDYDNDKMQKYKTLYFIELPDGRVVLKYGGVRYYSTKDAVMQLPFPFPKKYFSKGGNWSSNVEQAFKMYRRHLAERKEPEGQPDGTCDDVSFDTCANNDPKTCKFCVNESRYEDKQKIAARKPGAPLMRASMGV